MEKECEDRAKRMQKSLDRIKECLSAKELAELERRKRDNSKESKTT
jgi:hypothetical protein